MSCSPQRIRVGTCTLLSSGSGGRVQKNARYQLIIAVTVPGCDQALRYWSRSSGVNVPGRLLPSSELIPPSKLLAEKANSGMAGNGKKAIYQLPADAAELVRTVRSNTAGCGTFRIVNL